MNWFFVLTMVMLPSVLVHAGEPDRFIKKIALPSGQTAVIAEGAFEARSIGSFSVRLYDAAPPADRTTFFTTGLIRSRHGTIEKVALINVDDNQRPEIIVFVRSAGTGSYLGAHAFAFDGSTLNLLATVENLPPQCDPIAALRKTISQLK